MAFRFEFDPGIESKAFQFRSSLNPLGDAVREATDIIGGKARGFAEAEAARWREQAEGAKSILKTRNKQDRIRYYRAKAMAYSLDVYAKTLRFSMVAADENYGLVTAEHAAGDAIEFGGVDSKIELGKTGEHLTYPAFGFLRRALSG